MLSLWWLSILLVAVSFDHNNGTEVKELSIKDIAEKLELLSVQRSKRFERQSPIYTFGAKKNANVQAIEKNSNKENQIDEKAQVVDVKKTNEDSASSEEKGYEIIAPLATKTDLEKSSLDKKEDVDKKVTETAVEMSLQEKVADDSTLTRSGAAHGSDDVSSNWPYQGPQTNYIKHPPQDTRHGSLDYPLHPFHPPAPNPYQFRPSPYPYHPYHYPYSYPYVPIPCPHSHYPYPYMYRPIGLRESN